MKLDVEMLARKTVSAWSDSRPYTIPVEDELDLQLAVTRAIRKAMKELSE